MQAQPVKRFVDRRLLFFIAAIVVGSMLAMIMLATIVDRSVTTAPRGESVIANQADVAPQSDGRSVAPPYQLPEEAIDAQLRNDPPLAYSPPNAGEGLIDGQRFAVPSRTPAVRSDVTFFLEENLYLPGDIGSPSAIDDLIRSYGSDDPEYQTANQCDPTPSLLEARTVTCS